MLLRMIIRSSFRLTRRQPGLVLCTLMSLALFQGWASATAQTYKVTDLGTLGGTRSQANDINDRGQIVGYSTLPGNAVQRAFLWQDGVMTELGSLGGTLANANAINNRGEAVGASELPGNVARHAVLFRDGEAIDLGATPGSQFSTAYGITQRGEIYGGSTTTGRGPYFHAVLYKDGEVVDLGTLGGPSSFASWVNHHGQSAGRADLPDGSSRAAVFSDGTITGLGTLPGGNYSAARAINNGGQVSGISNNANGEFHAFLLSDGVMTDLGTLGGTSSDASGHSINNSGEVIGQSTTANKQLHAFLFANGVMRDLNDLIPAGSGWVLTAALAINDAGAIVGAGTINGQTHGFLLTPEAN